MADIDPGVSGSFGTDFLEVVGGSVLSEILNCLEFFGDLEILILWFVDKGEDLVFFFEVLEVDAYLDLEFFLDPTVGFSVGDGDTGSDWGFLAWAMGTGCLKGDSA